MPGHHEQDHRRDQTGSPPRPNPRRGADWYPVAGDVFASLEPGDHGYGHKPAGDHQWAIWRQ
jgi:hypothetical protein